MRATPAEIVHHHLAMQAQDYPGVKWSIGLRSTNLADADVENAIRDGSIVRTWPMRGTLHLLAASDVRWMLALLAPRAQRAAAGRYRQLELDEATFSKSARILERVLGGNVQSTRAELFEALESAGIQTAGQRGIHILGWACQNALTCMGPIRGKQPTFVLLDNWVPPADDVPRDEALARLTTRYLASHGPATDADLARWSGITLTDARTGIEAASSQLDAISITGITYWTPRDSPPRSLSRAGVFLLPGFDEYLLGYRDRSAAIEPAMQTRLVPGLNGVFKPTIVVEGRVVGTWSRKRARATTSISIDWFPEFGARGAVDLTPAVDRFAAFLQTSINVV